MKIINKQDVFEILLNNKDEVKENITISLLTLKKKILENKALSEEIYLQFEEQLISSLVKIAASKTSASAMDVQMHIETLVELGEIDELLESIMSPEEAVLVMLNEENLHSDDSE